MKDLCLFASAFHSLRHANNKKEKTKQTKQRVTWFPRTFKRTCTCTRIRPGFSLDRYLHIHVCTYGARYGIRYAYGVRTHSSFARNSNQLHKCIVNDCKYNMFLETFSFKLILNWHPRGRGPTTSIVFTWVGPGTSSLTIDLSLNFWSLRPPFLNGRCM